MQVSPGPEINRNLNIGISKAQKANMKSSRRDVPQDQSYKSPILRHPFSQVLILWGTQAPGSWSPIACDRVRTEPLTADICKLSSTTAKINANLISFWSHLPWGFDNAPHSLEPGNDLGRYNPHKQNCSPILLALVSPPRTVSLLLASHPRFHHSNEPPAPLHQISCIISAGPLLLPLNT